MEQAKFIVLMGALYWAVGACDATLPDAPDPEDLLAEPVAGLTPQQLATHLAGDAEFARIFGAADGLGPIFVAGACEGCHVGDGKGHPITTLTRFGRYENGTWDPMVAHGGPQLQHRALAGYTPESIPPGATGVTRLMPPAVTGLGFLEAVPDAAVLAMADPDDADGDGISGVPNWIAPPDYLVPGPGKAVQSGQYIGRFGKKAGAINLLHQVVTAYRQDMGVTSDFDTEELYNAQQGPFTGDTVPDPEVSADVVRNVVFYVQTLKVPPRRNEGGAEVAAGASLFAQINCTGCHVPALQTGISDIAVLSEQAIHPYTDLLMHDMGPALDDGYTEGTASSAEWRTTPLWGIGLAADSQGGRAFYLHDGRASTLTEAIDFHGGEAARSREAFFALTPEQQAQVIAFLESL